MIETREPVDPAGLAAILGPCVRTATIDGVTRVWCDDDAKVSDDQLAAAIAEHVPVKPPLEGLPLLAAVLLTDGSIDEATACKIAGRPLEVLVAEAEAWAAVKG